MEWTQLALMVQSKEPIILLPETKKQRPADDPAQQPADATLAA